MAALTQGEWEERYQDEGMDVMGSVMASADAAAMAGMNRNNTHYCSMEQVFSPITVTKGIPTAAEEIRGAGPTGMPELPKTEDGKFGGGDNLNEGAVGPTLFELNPYFSQISGDDGSSHFASCDYQLVINNGRDSRYGQYGGELNIHKIGWKDPEGDEDDDLEGGRAAVGVVRTIGLRGPVLVSGWGFDLSDNSAPGSFDDRTTWATGPIDLKWDTERKVWSGGHQIICGFAKAADVVPPPPLGDPGTPKKKFELKVLRWTGERELADGNIGIEGDPKCEISEETVQCVNRDPNLDLTDSENDDVFIVAIRINYEWIAISPSGVVVDTSALEARMDGAEDRLDDLEE